jgi:hypothetical protein
MIWQFEWFKQKNMKVFAFYHPDRRQEIVDVFVEHPKSRIGNRVLMINSRTSLLEKCLNGWQKQVVFLRHFMRLKILNA